MLLTRRDVPRRPVRESWRKFLLNLLLHPWLRVLPFAHLLPQLLWDKQQLRGLRAGIQMRRWWRAANTLQLLSWLCVHCGGCLRVSLFRVRNSVYVRRRGFTAQYNEVSHAVDLPFLLYFVVSDVYPLFSVEYSLPVDNNFHFVVPRANFQQLSAHIS